MLLFSITDAHGLTRIRKALISFCGYTLKSTFCLWLSVVKLALLTVFVSVVQAGDIQWTGLDGLTAKTENGELVVDTMVLESDWVKRQEELKKDAKAPAWKKSDVPEVKLDDCVGRINGVRVKSEPVKVEGADFMFSVEMKGTDGPFIYIEGYSKGTSVGRIFLKASGRPGRWITNEKVVKFSKPADSAVVEIFCLRPCGEYRFRNTVLKKGSAPVSGGNSGNLVFNPGFELGKDAPEGWEGIDDLTVFWEKSRKGNHYIRMDTDVYKSDWEKRRDELKENPDAPAWKKTPTKGPKYNTIGGTLGVSLWSRNIPVEKDTVYQLRVRMKGPSAGTEFIPKVFIKGYARVKGQYRKVYQAYKNCRDSAGEWKWHEREFSPASKTPSVEYIRIQLYAYWPPGEYLFDDVSVVKLEGKKPDNRPIPNREENLPAEKDTSGKKGKTQ